MTIVCDESQTNDPSMAASPRRPQSLALICTRAIPTSGATSPVICAGRHRTLLRLPWRAYSLTSFGIELVLQSQHPSVKQGDHIYNGGLRAHRVRLGRLSRPVLRPGGRSRIHAMSGCVHQLSSPFFLKGNMRCCLPPPCYADSCINFHKPSQTKGPTHAPPAVMLRSLDRSDALGRARLIELPCRRRGEDGFGLRNFHTRKRNTGMRLPLAMQSCRRRSPLRLSTAMNVGEEYGETVQRSSRSPPRRIVYEALCSACSAASLNSIFRMIEVLYEGEIH
ncbi:uncharacterized protein B0H18DRAFT_136903 [Fomitopsis serialis]|uniref:uncharacterized protein n=1 Tax=Fomitopsis serialis TaxID=139415 RepID=UPI0020081C78|nr:uncharacterized protein B0H18DRAFT_136903 [Neoantrodia serialis]KAH9914347.1 hypothetical protein B0H18DRAFT_136903 [Neoantrodia serialis]